MDPELALILGDELSHFIEMLNKLFSTSNEERAHAEGLFARCRNDRPDDLANQLMDVHSSGCHYEDRILCSVLTCKILTPSDEFYIWHLLSLPVQTKVKSFLFTYLKHEHVRAVSKNLCEAMAEVATVLLPDGDWHELLPVLFTFINSHFYRHPDDDDDDAVPHESALALLY